MHAAFMLCLTSRAEPVTSVPPCLVPHVTICCTLSDAVYAGLPGYGPTDASNAAPSVDTLRFAGMHVDTGIQPQQQHHQGFSDPTTVSLLYESNIPREDSVDGGFGAVSSVQSDH